MFRQQMFLPTEKQFYPAKDHAKEKELLAIKENSEACVWRVNFWATRTRTRRRRSAKRAPVKQV